MPTITTWLVLSSANTESVAASLVNLVVALVLQRAGRQHDSVTLVASAQHLLADVNGARREALRAALSVLTPAELTQFDALVATMVGRLSAARTPPASAEGDAQVISGFSIAVPPAEAGETA